MKIKNKTDSNHGLDLLRFPKKENLDRRRLKYPIMKRLNKFSDSYLEEAYNITCSHLNKYYYRQSTVTSFEKHLYKSIKEHTRLEVRRSFWIGNMNVDLFIPGVQSYPQGAGSITLKGLVIEVNGETHEKYVGMKKDTHKLSVILEDLGIIFCVINNEDIAEALVRLIIENLSTLKPIDSRSKVRLLRNIHLKTIIEQRHFIQKNELLLPLQVLNALNGTV